MLGIRIKVAIARQQAASGDWANYGTGVSRRPEQRVTTHNGAH
jgi:hypothetical protein